LASDYQPSNLVLEIRRGPMLITKAKLHKIPKVLGDRGSLLPKLHTGTSSDRSNLRQLLLF